MKTKVEISDQVLNFVWRFAGVRPCFRFSGAGTTTNVRRATWAVYDDANHEVRTAQGYATGAQWDTFTLINPVSIIRFDEAGNVLEEIQAGGTWGNVVSGLDLELKVQRAAGIVTRALRISIVDGAASWGQTRDSGLGTKKTNERTKKNGHFSLAS